MHDFMNMAIAEDHRADLLASAERQHLARTARAARGAAGRSPWWRRHRSTDEQVGTPPVEAASPSRRSISLEPIERRELSEPRGRSERSPAVVMDDENITVCAK